MFISLRDYEPWMYVDRVDNYVSRQPQEHWKEVAKLVALIALFPIIAISTLVLDVAYICAKKVYVWWNRQPLPPREGVTPSQKLIEQVLTPPKLPRPRTFVPIFARSIRWALGVLDKKTRDIYKKLVKSEGVEIGDLEEAPIEVFQWSAGCAVAADLVEGAIYDTLSGYDKLNRNEKAAVLLQVIVPETRWKLSGDAVAVLYALNAEALRITRTLTFCSSYRAIIKNI